MNMLDNIKYVFQIPLAWFRAVNAFCFGSYGGNLIRITRGKDGAASFDVDENELAQLIPQAQTISREIGTPTDATNDNGSISTNVFDTTGDTLSWAAGGANGLMLDCYCRLNPQTAGGNYSVFQRCRLTFSKDGLLVSGVLMSDRIRIRTANS